jgi:hypothetical protein
MEAVTMWTFATLFLHHRKHTIDFDICGTVFMKSCSHYTSPKSAIHSAPTIVSTFGSTPTVSKETTGPPTMYAGRDRSRFKEDVTTDCREITGGYPIVCVKVCTSITSVFDGDRLIDETAESTEEECD